MALCEDAWQRGISQLLGVHAWTVMCSAKQKMHYVGHKKVQDSQSLMAQGCD